MEIKLKTYRSIQEKAFLILISEKFNTAIEMHCNLIMDEFKKRTLFYKFIFSNNRFIISTVTASVFYSQREAYLSDVTHQCLTTGLVTPNTVSSLLELFKVSGRISVIESKTDRRKKLYIMNPKGEKDILVLLNTMVLPLKNIFPNPATPDILEESHLPAFFSEYAKIHSSSLFLLKIVEYSEIFITKDAGHMILVNIYITSIKGANTKETLSSIAKKCCVSRAHLRSIVKEAEIQELVTFSSRDSKIHVHDKFISMFKNYMAYYFSFIQYGLEGV